MECDWSSRVVGFAAERKWHMVIIWWRQRDDRAVQNPTQVNQVKSQASEPGLKLDPPLSRHRSSYPRSNRLPLPRKVNYRCVWLLLFWAWLGLIRMHCCEVLQMNLYWGQIYKKKKPFSIIPLLHRSIGTFSTKLLLMRSPFFSVNMLTRGQKQSVMILPPRPGVPVYYARWVC